MLVKCDLPIAETAGVRHMLHTRPVNSCVISRKVINLITKKFVYDLIKIYCQLSKLFRARTVLHLINLIKIKQCQYFSRANAL